LKILDINVINFRNIKEKKFEFADTITYVYGENGSGKTNLLEAIYYLSCGKSFRNVKDSDIRMRETEYFHVDGTVSSDDTKHKIAMGMKSGEKKIILDGKNIKKVSELFGVFIPVVFSPEDTSVINGSPMIRRRFIDRMIASTDNDYIIYLKKYNYALEQRNKLFREAIDNDENLLYAYEKILTKNGIIIAERRRETVDKLNEIITDIYFRITGAKDRIFVNYKSEFTDGDRDDLLLRYRNKRGNDKLLKRTSFGVHTDDIQIVINGENSRYFASTGEKKSLVVALRIAESDIYNKIKNEYPVMLLDDIFSELDEKRRRNLLKFFIDKAQVIITSPERYDIGTGVAYINMEQIDG